MGQLVDQLKSKGKHEEAGRLAAQLGQPRHYGCHFGMKSARVAAIEAFLRGYDSYEK